MKPRHPSSPIRWLVHRFTSPAHLDAERVISASQRCSAVASLMASLEALSVLIDSGKRSRLRMEWEHSQHSYDRAPRAVQLAVRATGPTPVRTSLHAARALLSLYVLAAPSTAPCRNIASAASGLITGLLYPVSRLGSDGADQVTAMSQFTAGVAGACGSERTRAPLLWALAMQNAMSYSVAGFAKLAGPDWRSEEALSGIMRTHTYGSPLVWSWMRTHPFAVRAVSTAVLLFECAFPIVFVAAPWVVRTMLLCAIGFHAANAAAMGLGRFLPSFLSLHPFVLYVSHANARRPGPTFPCIVIVLTAATVGAFAFGQRRAEVDLQRANERRQDLVLPGWCEGEEGVHLRQSSRGIVIFEGGLGTLEQEASVVRSELARGGLRLVTRCRIGAESEPRSLLDVRAAELADVVRSIRSHDEGPIVLLGYSLGAEVVRRAVAHHGAPADGVLLLDPTHPGEMVRSSKKRATLASIDCAMQLFEVATAVGLGFLIEAPMWMKRLSSDERRAALVQYRSSGHWRRVRAEWRAAREVLIETGSPSPSRLPTRVVSARRSLREDPVQESLHEELAQMVGGARRPLVMLERVRHDEILGDAGAVSTIARTTCDLFDEVDRSCSGGRESS